MEAIPFNKPHLAGRELFYIAQAVELGNISADGEFTRRCSRLLEERCQAARVLMAPSCTAALEMAVLLCELGPGDEVILPSFTFVSSASAVVRAGATPVFVDVRPDTLNLDETLLEAALTPYTRAIMPMHYAGVGCEMRAIMALAERHGLRVIEDAAHAVDASYRGRELGSIGHLGCFSFHETKNLICGEGGALCVNDPDLVPRAEILRDKGTDRQRFLRGEVDRYTWVDVGSSWVASEILCAFLLAQLERMPELTARRRAHVAAYRKRLLPLEAAGHLRLPVVPKHCESNAHAFFVLLHDRATRDALMDHLRARGISAVFHYVPLHDSPVGRRVGRTPAPLPVTEDVAGRLLRLPLFHELEEAQIARVTGAIEAFFGAGT